MSRVLTTEPCPLVTTARSGETEFVMGQLEQRNGVVGMGVEIEGDPRGMSLLGYAKHPPRCVIIPFEQMGKFRQRLSWHPSPQRTRAGHGN